MGITIGGNIELSDFGDIHISRQISGVGISGISVSSLTFKTIDDNMELAGIAASVVLDGIGNIPTFYINNRSYHDGVWTIECLDRCAFLDKKIDTTGWSKQDETYASSAISASIASECGFGSVSLPAGTPVRIKAECVDGKTYQAFLNELAEAYCGFFCSTYTDTLMFVPYSQTTSLETIQHHSVIHNNGSYSYGSVFASDGQNTVEYGSGLPTLTINNDLVDTTADYSGLVSTTFYGWSVDRAVSEVGDMPSLGGTLTMQNTNYRVTRVNGQVIGDKLVLSAGGDIPQLGEINRRGLLQQRLDNAVSTDKTYGTVKPTNDKDLGFCAVPNKR